MLEEDDSPVSMSNTWMLYVTVSFRFIPPQRAGWTPEFSNSRNSI